MALLVVNGRRFDTDLVRELDALPGARVIRQEKADLPTALRIGRANVATPWFSELDDDDELMPDALAARLSAARAASDCDVVVSNGFVRNGERVSLHVDSWTAVRRDPLRALAQGNWLRPGACLFRTSAVAVEIFDGMPRYLEWTYIALQLTMQCRLLFLDRPTFYYSDDTPDSLSKSSEYLFGQADAIARLLQLDLPRDLRRIFRWRQTVACNTTAQAHMRANQLRTAWRWHWRTLRNHKGWRFLPNTRKLLRRQLALMGRKSVPSRG